MFGRPHWGQREAELCPPLYIYLIYEMPRGWRGSDLAASRRNGPGPRAPWAPGRLGALPDVQSAVHHCLGLTCCTGGGGGIMIVARSVTEQHIDMLHAGMRYLCSALTCIRSDFPGTLRASLPHTLQCCALPQPSLPHAMASSEQLLTCTSHTHVAQAAQVTRQVEGRRRGICAGLLRVPHRRCPCANAPLVEAGIRLLAHVACT